MPNPSWKSYGSGCAKYANHGHELPPEAAAKESRRLDEARLYLLTREPDESLGAWRKRDSILGHLRAAVDAGLLVGRPFVLDDNRAARARGLVSPETVPQLTLDTRDER